MDTREHWPGHIGIRDNLAPARVTSYREIPVANQHCSVGATLINSKDVVQKVANEWMLRWRAVVRSRSAAIAIVLRNGIVESWIDVLNVTHDVGQAVRLCVCPNWHSRAGQQVDFVRCRPSKANLRRYTRPAIDFRFAGRVADTRDDHC